MGLWWYPIAIFGVCGLLVLLGGVLSGSRSKDGPPLRPGFTCGVVGLRGHGKSLFVARLIAQRLHAGVNVVANFAVPGCVRMVTWVDVILAPPRSFVVLDEAQTWAPSTAGQSLDPMAQWYFSHSRKLEHEVFWITQDETAVSSKVRVQTNEMIEVRRMSRKWHRAASYSPRQFRKARAKALWAWWYTPSGAAIRVYDTMELVRPVAKEANAGPSWVEVVNACIDEIYRRRGLVLDHVSESPGAVAVPELNLPALPARLT